MFTVHNNVIIEKGLFSELKIHILVHWNEHYHREQILSVRNDDEKPANGNIFRHCSFETTAVQNLPLT